MNISVHNYNIEVGECLNGCCCQYCVEGNDEQANISTNYGVLL